MKYTILFPKVVPFHFRSGDFVFSRFCFESKNELCFQLCLHLRGFILIPATGGNTDFPILNRAFVRFIEVL